MVLLVGETILKLRRCYWVRGALVGIRRCGVSEVRGGVVVMMRDRGMEWRESDLAAGETEISFM